MIEDIQLAAEDMSRRIAEQEVIANNLANVNTAGFKRDRVFLDVLTEATTESDTETEEITVFDQGPVKETGNPLDMALVSEGFFTIQTPEGIRYTRNGSFRLDPEGQLMLVEDALVMGENGPIEVRGEVSVNERGEVFVNHALVDRLRVVTFDKPYPLRKLGNSLFVLEDESTPEIEVENVRMKQGFLEESNVNAIEEMVAMLTLFRYFEADQKVLQTQDDILGKAANDIGKVY
jgi:flagellar basal-body rod protein FlgF